MIPKCSLRRIPMIHSRGVNNANQKAIQAGYGSGVHHQQKTPIQVQMDPHPTSTKEKKIGKKKQCI
jgi:hypothetical protein